MAKPHKLPIDKYKGKRMSYPADEIDPKLKREKKYFLDVNNALYCDYINNRLCVPYDWGDGRSLDELRAYATGTQSPEKIKKWLLKRDKQKGSYVTKMNVSFDGYAKMPQLLDIMRSRNMSQEYDVDLTCIDTESMAAIESSKAALKFMLDANTVSFLNKAKYTPEIQPNPQQLGLENAEEVDNYFDAGGFSLQWQMAAEAACAKSKIESYYKEFQDTVMDDLIINTRGLAGAKTYIEPGTKIPKFRRVDMRYALCPWSKYRNFRDIMRAGELRAMTIGDIAREHPHLLPQQLYDIALNFQYMNPPLGGFLNGLNGGWVNWRTSASYNSSVDPVMAATVWVLDAQWLSVDIQTTIKNEHRGFYKSVDFDYKLNAKDAKNGDEKIKKKVIKKYYSQWIVGSEIMLDYGICEDVVYYGQDGNKTPRLDYFFTTTGNMSLVERCVAIIDDMNLINVKHRNAWATLPAAPAIAVQQNIVENVMLNGIAQQPEDIMRAFYELGILYYNSLDDNGDPLFMAGGAKPIEQMDVGKMAQMLTVCTQELLVKANEIREVLGLQSGADGGQKSPYQGLGETELAFQAANASLQPTFNSYHYLFQDVFTDIIKKWQIVAKQKKAVKLPYSALGVNNMKMLELSYPFTSAEFSVGVSIAPSSQEKSQILQDLLQLKALGQTTGGAQGISHAQYLFCYEKVMAGQIKAAYFILAKIESKQRAEQRAQQMQDQQANIQSQQESALIKGQIDAQNIQTKGQVDKENSVIQELLKTNRDLTLELIKGRKEGEGLPDAALAASVIAQANAEVMELLEPEQPTEEETMIAEAPLEPPIT